MGSRRLRRTGDNLLDGLKTVPLVVGSLVVYGFLLGVLDALNLYNGIAAVVAVIPAIGLIALLVLWGLTPLAWMYDSLRAPRQKPTERD